MIHHDEKKKQEAHLCQIHQHRNYQIVVTAEFCRIVNHRITKTIQLMTKKEALVPDDIKAIQMLLDVAEMTSVEHLKEMQDNFKRCPVLPNNTDQPDQ